MGRTLLEFAALFVTVMFLGYDAMILLALLRRPRNTAAEVVTRGAVAVDG